MGVITMISRFLGLPGWLHVTLAVSILATAFGSGWMVRGWKCDAAQAKVITKVIAIKEKNAERVNDEAVKYERGNAADKASQQRAREKIKVIYDSKAVYSNCAVPDDARRVLEERIGDANARAGGQPPSTLSYPSFTPQPPKRSREAPLGGRTNITLWDVRLKTQAYG